MELESNRRHCRHTDSNSVFNNLVHFCPSRFNVAWCIIYFQWVFICLSILFSCNSCWKDVPSTAVSIYKTDNSVKLRLRRFSARCFIEVHCCISRQERFALLLLCLFSMNDCSFVPTAILFLLFFWQLGLVQICMCMTSLRLGAPLGQDRVTRVLTIHLICKFYEQTVSYLWSLPSRCYVLHSFLLFFIIFPGSPGPVSGREMFKVQGISFCTISSYSPTLEACASHTKIARMGISKNRKREAV